MEIAGKKFAVRSVFPKAAASTPTDKLISLNDKEQEIVIHYRDTGVIGHSPKKPKK